MLNDAGTHETDLGKCTHQYDEKLGNKNTQALSFFSSFLLFTSVQCSL